MAPPRNGIVHANVKLAALLEVRVFSTGLDPVRWLSKPNVHQSREFPIVGAKVGALVGVVGVHVGRYVEG